MPDQTQPQNQSLASSYSLKVAAVLIILAAVWFGSSFSKNKNKENQIEPASLPRGTLAASVLPTAQDVFLIPFNETIIPIRKWTVDEPEFSAQSIYAVETNSGKILLQKNEEEIRPIASLSKLMTALIIIERADLQDIITVSKNAIDTYGEMGNLVTGEEISVESLLYALLVESSNDAAVALAESSSGGDGQFIGFMNEKARELGLKNSLFSDPSGLSTKNVSTAKELAKLLQEVIKYPELNQIMKTTEIDVHSSDGKNNHHLVNSNKLLSEYPEIIAGKTGYIDEAGECMILALRAPNGQGLIINVMLASQDRLSEMDKLIRWEKEAFLW